MILKKLTAQFGADNVKFRSSFELDRLFKKACGLLNSRPIFYNDTEFVSVKSLTCPGFGSDNLKEILSENDTNFQTFLNLFDQAIVSGQYQKFGGKSTVPAADFKKGDFVLVIF